jgi:hypothetical protein
MKGKWIDVDLKGKDKFDADAEYRIKDVRINGGIISDCWYTSITAINEEKITFALFGSQTPINYDAK